MKPLTALEMEGRDIYIREGCHVCHTQMVRPLRAETERYGGPLNTTKVWARHPQLMAAYTAWRQAMNDAATAIPAELKYLVYVRVASLNGCPF
jgi:alkylhydroperoxidase family enzyme